MPSPRPPTCSSRPRRLRRSALVVGPVAAAALALGACGSSTTTATTAPATARAVSTVNFDVTAQMLAAAPGASSSSDEAAFDLSAVTSSGKPAANQPVSFWVGPMVPLSGHPPAHWYQSGTSTARPYIDTASTITDSAGHARIVLWGQPSGSMEMVAVRVGSLDSFDVSAQHAVGDLDAWWTSPSAPGAAPVGDRVTVTPFLAVASSAKPVLRVSLVDGAGKPIGSAAIDFTAKAVKTGASSTSGSSGAMSPGSGSMSAPAGVTVASASTGSATFDVPNAGPTAVRIVVTDGASHTRVAGGMSTDTVAAS